jgi:hypothetical protein
MPWLVSCDIAIFNDSVVLVTPTEVISGDKGDSQIGSSKLAGVRTKVLAGNPSSLLSPSFVCPLLAITRAFAHREIFFACPFLSGRAGLCLS